MVRRRGGSTIGQATLLAQLDLAHKELMNENVSLGRGHAKERVATLLDAVRRYVENDKPEIEELLEAASRIARDAGLKAEGVHRLYKKVAGR